MEWPARETGEAVLPVLEIEARAGQAAPSPLSGSSFSYRDIAPSSKLLVTSSP
jgi:hypothetical protein